MDPTIGRLALNIIFILSFLDVLALIFLKPSDVEFYVAIMGLIVLGAFLAFTIFEVRREARRVIRIPTEEILTI